MKNNYQGNDPDRNLARNTFGIASVEFFWGLGLPVVLESTFLQLFLKEIGASSVIVGFIPSFYFIGQAFFGLFSAYVASHMEYKRTVLITIHCLNAFFIFLFGIYLLLFGFGNNVVGVFLVIYALFSMGIGLVRPVWQNYLVLILSPGRVVLALSIMMMSQSAARFIGSFLIGKVVGRFSFTPFAVALIFITCGLIFFASSFLFLFTREPMSGSDSISPEQSGFWVFLRESIAEVVGNKNFLFFLGTELEYFAVVTVLSFYAIFATEYYEVGATMAAGGFIGFNYAGQFFVNWFFGIHGVLGLKKMAYLSRICSLVGILSMVFLPSIPVLLGASVLLGISLAMRFLIYVPVVKEISRQNDATHYFAVAPLLTVPVSGGISLLSGHYLDVFGQLGEWSYRSLFIFMAVCIAISILFLKKSRF